MFHIEILFDRSNYNIFLIILFIIYCINYKYLHTICIASKYLAIVFLNSHTPFIYAKLIIMYEF